MHPTYRNFAPKLEEFCNRPNPGAGINKGFAACPILLKVYKVYNTASARLDGGGPLF